jgi:hypothetical protein
MADLTAEERDVLFALAYRGDGTIEAINEWTAIGAESGDPIGVPRVTFALITLTRCGFCEIPREDALSITPAGRAEVLRLLRS